MLWLDALLEVQKDPENLIIQWPSSNVAKWGMLQARCKKSNPELLERVRTTSSGATAVTALGLTSSDIKFYFRTDFAVVRVHQPVFVKGKVYLFHHHKLTLQAIKQTELAEVRRYVLSCKYSCCSPPYNIILEGTEVQLVRLLTAAGTVLPTSE